MDYWCTQNGIHFGAMKIEKSPILLSHYNNDNNRFIGLRVRYIGFLILLQDLLDSSQSIPTRLRLFIFAFFLLYGISSLLLFLIAPLITIVKRAITIAKKP